MEDFVWMDETVFVVEHIALDVEGEAPELGAQDPKILNGLLNVSNFLARSSSACRLKSRKRCINKGTNVVFLSLFSASVATSCNSIASPNRPVA